MFRYAPPCPVRLLPDEVPRLSVLLAEIVVEKVCDVGVVHEDRVLITHPGSHFRETLGFQYRMTFFKMSQRRTDDGFGCGQEYQILVDFP